VLIDVPMDVQQLEMDGFIDDLPGRSSRSDAPSDVAGALSETFAKGRRPIVLWGGGIGLAGVQHEVADWLAKTKLPFVSSWAGLGFFDHGHAGFLGQIGVYGNRGANFVLQNADTVLVLGSRLDNRQRSGNPRNFVTGANVHVLDVDEEELKKYLNDGYRTNLLDFSLLPAVLSQTAIPAAMPEWAEYVAAMKARYFGREVSTSAQRLNTLSPYDIIRRINTIIADDAIVIADTGACVCWVHQAIKIKNHTLFTAGGNSPMGYGLPAAIGAKLVAPDRQVVSFNGDGGFQLNIQELQTLKHHNLDVAIVVMNNSSYGIIKQFQDSYLGSRYTASRDGYSTPDFGRVAAAYGLRYARIERLDQITPDLFGGGPIVIDVILSEHTLIEPKLEMGRPISDQYPYLSEAEYAAGNRFVDYPRPDAFRALVS
jgi:acetolactate synthase-1/2/3 large subunit